MQARSDSERKVVKMVVRRIHTRTRYNNTIWVQRSVHALARRRPLMLNQASQLRSFN